METKLIYLCFCPWARLADFLSNVGGFVPSQVYPSRDGKAAIVEFTPLASEVVALVELVEFFKEKHTPNGKENN